MAKEVPIKYLKENSEEDSGNSGNSKENSKDSKDSEYSNDIQTVLLDLPPITDEEYPTVSILTPTYNRYDFVDLMIRNFKTIDYPREKLEWIIVDDSDNSLSEISSEKRKLLDFIDKYNKEYNTYFNNRRDSSAIKYVKIKYHMILGAKRNLLATLAKNEYLVHMDDDDFYPSTSVAARIRTLLLMKKNYSHDFIVGCPKVNCYDLIKDNEFEALDKDEMSGGSRTLSESTLAYHKNVFKEQPYGVNDKTAECLNFIKGREEFIVTLPSSFAVTQLTHGNNTINRTVVEGSTVANFRKNLSAHDDKILTDIKAKILLKDPTYKKIVSMYVKFNNALQENDKHTVKQFFKEYDNPLKCTDPLREVILSNQLFIDLRRNFFHEETRKISSKKSITYYCGPGSHLKFSSKWSPTSKIIGGSEEAVINLSNQFFNKDYHVTVYCLLDPVFEIRQKKALMDGYTGVIYKNYWEWIPSTYQDITIIWRDPTILTTINEDPLNKINSPKIILDLHDYFTNPNLFEGLEKIEPSVTVMTKSNFHKDSLKNLKESLNICVVPNGISVPKLKNFEKELGAMISTSSPDRCLMALLKMLPIVRKEIPYAKVYWAYGFEAGVSKGGLLADTRPQVQEFVKEVNSLMKVTEGFVDMGRLSQEEVWKLYRKGDLFVYGTTFPEIDCISFTKAISQGCIPVVTPVGALAEKVGAIVLEIPCSTNIDKSLHEGPEFDKWVADIISVLKNSERDSLRSSEAAKAYDWSSVADQWLRNF